MTSMKKVFRKLNENKILILAGAAAVTLMVVLLLDSGSSHGPTTPPKYKKSPYKIPRDIGNEEDENEEAHKSAASLEVVRVEPEGNLNVSYRNISIYITFTEPVVKETVRITINPPIPYKIAQGGANKFIVWITPDPAWNFDTEYHITINKGIKSEYGNALKEDHEHTFSLTKVAEPIVF